MSSVMSTLCDPMDYTVHGILQARILEWVAFPFSRGSSQPRDRTGVYCIADGFFTNWAVREALRGQSKVQNQDIRDQGEGVEDSQVWCWLRTNQIKSRGVDQMNDQKTEIDKETKSWTNWFWKGWHWKAEMGLFWEHQWPHLWIEKKLAGTYPVRTWTSGEEKSRWLWPCRRDYIICLSQFRVFKGVFVWPQSTRTSLSHIHCKFPEDSWANGEVGM